MNIRRSVTFTLEGDKALEDQAKSGLAVAKFSATGLRRSRVQFTMAILDDNGNVIPPEEIVRVAREHLAKKEQP